MTDDTTFAAALRTMATLSYIHNQLVTGGKRGYTIDNTISSLETMLEEGIEFLSKQKGQVTRQETHPAPPDSEISF